VDRLRQLIRAGATVALTDVVMMELLEGAAEERAAARLERRLRDFPILRLGELDDFRHAAAIARDGKRAGVTLRSKLDLLIATVCIREDAPILHADADFDRLASCTRLRIYE
jgi:predicted nucleic acid-binding protein